MNYRTLFGQNPESIFDFFFRTKRWRHSPGIILEGTPEKTLERSYNESRERNAREIVGEILGSTHGKSTSNA